MKKRNKIWIAWEDDGSIRSRVLAEELNSPFYTFTFLEGNNYLVLLRYLFASCSTIWTIFTNKPAIVVVQCPSIILTILASLTKNIFKYKLIVDLHSLIIEQDNLLNKFLFKSLKKCDIVIVTNKTYANLLTAKTGGINILIIPDKIPDFQYPFKKIPLKGKCNILYTGGFSNLEPGNEVLCAMKYLPEDYYLYVTGKDTIKKTEVPKNCILTGYIPDETYQNLFRSVDIVVVLTKNKYSLVCGAYEAISAEKPLILSDTEVLKGFFSRGTIFASNEAQELAVAIKNGLKQKQELTIEMKIEKKKKTSCWVKSWENLIKEISF